MALAGIDFFIIILYFVGVVILGTYFTRYVKSSGDFFLAGKMLPWWAIGMSLVVSDIGALDFIAVSGQGFKYGIVVANFDWIGCLPPIILAAFISAPTLWRAGVYTIPEYMGLRYNNLVRAIQGLLWGLFLTANLGVMFWATGLMLNEFVPIPDTLLGGTVKAVLEPIWGEHWPIMVHIILIGVAVGIYTGSGGLSAVVMTDVVQLVVMFVGGIAVIAVGLYQVGGISGLKEAIYALGPEYSHHFDLLLPVDHPSPYPWPAIIFGLAFVLAPAYWLGNQAIIQRTLGAQSEWDAKAGTLFAGFLHALIPILIAFPGLIGLALYAHEVQNSDLAFPYLIHKLLPAGMTGLVFAAFMAALMSSVDSVLNSAATLWTRDIYQQFLFRRKSDRHYLTVGRILTALFVLGGIFAAPVVNYFESIYQAIQNFLTFIQGPNLALLLFGLLWKRANGKGALAGLFAGLTTSIGLFTLQRFYHLFTQDDPFLYIAWWSFVASVAVTVSVSLLTKPPSPDKIRGLVFRLAREDREVQAALEKRAEG